MVKIKVTKFLVTHKQGGIINFNKKEDAVKFAKLARLRGVKGIGVSKTFGRLAPIDNTRVVAKLKGFNRTNFNNFIKGANCPRKIKVRRR